MRHICLLGVFLTCIFYAQAFRGSISGPSHVCTGSHITLTDTASGGVWSSSGVTIAQIGYTSGIVTGIGSGIAQIIYMKPGFSDTFVIYVDPFPFPISGPSRVCSGDSIVLHDSIPGGYWLVSNPAVATMSSNVLLGHAGGLDTVSYVVVYSCGNAISTKVVSVTASPAIGTITCRNFVCTGVSDTLHSTVPGGTWTSSATGIAHIVADSILSATTGGITTVGYSVTANGCMSVATQTVTVHTMPVIGNISGATSVCTGARDTLRDTTAGGTWSVSNHNLTIGATSGVATGASGGVDTVRYSKSTVCGVLFSKKIINIYPTPVAGVITSAKPVLCVAEKDTFFNATGGGVWSKTNSFANVSGTGVVTGESAGVDTIIYTVSSTHGCGNASTQKVVSISPLPNTGYITGGGGVCTGDTLNFSINTTGGVWGSSNPSMVNVKTNGNVTALLAGIDTITYTTSNYCGTNVAMKKLLIYQTPQASPIIDTAANNILCSGSSITLMDTSFGGRWIGKKGLCVVNSNTGVVKGVTPGKDTILYVIASPYGCQADTASIGLNIIGLTSAGRITGSNVTCVGHQEIYVDTVKGGRWAASNDNILSISSKGIVLPILTGYDTVLYIVSSTGCGGDTAAFPIAIESEILCKMAAASIQDEPVGAFTVYPNPAGAGFIEIGITGEYASTDFALMDVSGKVLFTRSVTESDTRIDISGLPNGNYWVMAYCRGVKLGVKQFIKY